MIRAKAGISVLIPILILAATIASAGAEVTLNGKPVPNTAKGTLLVREGDCRALARHQPREDVTYKPGQDIQGNVVPPADLEPPLDLRDRAENFAFAVSVDLDDRLGKSGEGQPRPFGGEGYIGYVEVRDGRAYWDGQPLDPDGIAAVSEACKNARHPTR